MTDELARGWDDLRRGRWGAARASFEAATAGEVSAEGFEGLSWAAWWRDDAGAVFAGRERAYALYKRRGDMAGAARMATWLAADELDFNGALSVSSGWLARAAPAGAARGGSRAWVAGVSRGLCRATTGRQCRRGRRRRARRAAGAPVRCP